MSAVYVLEAEHNVVPGRILEVYAREADAVAEAVRLVNQIRTDNGCKPNATSTNWQRKAVALDRAYHTVRCFVEITAKEIK